MLSRTVTSRMLLIRCNACVYATVLWMQREDVLDMRADDSLIQA